MAHPFSTDLHILSYTIFVLIVTYYYKFSGLKQYQLLSEQLWSSGVQHGSQWTKISVSQSYVPSGDAREELVSLPFPDSRGCLHSFAWVSSHCIFPALFPSIIISPTLTLPLPSFTYQYSYDYTGPAQTVQGNLSISRSLT